MPRVHTDLPELLAFTRENLDTYWRGAIAEVEDEGVGVVGEDAAAVAWIALGASRLHHLLNKGTLTSKSGAGRYVAEKLAPRWSKIGREALRIRETPHTPSLYTELAERGHDVQQLLIWLVEDGTH